MSAVPVQAAASFELLNSNNEVIIQTPVAFSEFDFSDLSPDQHAILLSSVHMFHQSHNRLNNELFMMSSHLATCKEIIGEKRFYPFAEKVLGFNRKRAGRLLKIYGVLDKHFRSNDGKFHPAHIENINQSALLLLADDSDSGELAEVLQQMAVTGKVTAENVRELMDRRAAENDASYKAIAAELEQEKRLAKEREDRAELDASRVRASMESLAEQVRRLSGQLEAQDEDMRKLQEQARQQAPKIVEKQVRVEVVPSEYKDKEDALAGIEAKMRDSLAQTQKIIDERNTVQEELDRLSQSMATKAAGATELARLRAKVEELQTMFPSTLLASIKSTDEAVKTEVAAIGEMLIRIGNQFKGA